MTSGEISNVLKMFAQVKKNLARIISGGAE